MRSSKEVIVEFTYNGLHDLLGLPEGVEIVDVFVDQEAHANRAFVVKLASDQLPGNVVVPQGEPLVKMDMIWDEDGHFQGFLPVGIAAKRTVA